MLTAPQTTTVTTRIEIPLVLAMDAFGAALGLSRAKIVRLAIGEWLHARTGDTHKTTTKEAKHDDEG